MKKIISMTKTILLSLAIATSATAGNDHTRPQEQGKNSLSTIISSIMSIHQNTDPNRETFKQEVVVLELMLYPDRGRTSDAQVISARRIDSAAPKVFARKGGSWQVTLHGKDKVGYVINDPVSDIEIENPEDAKTPFSEVAIQAPHKTTLIIPLYHPESGPIAAQEIEIVDTRINKTVLWAQVP